MLRADLHIHSTFSDGKLTIPELVDFYGRHEFDVIAITDHICESNFSVMGKFAHYLKYTLTPSNFPIYLEILKSEAERALKQYDMLLLPGLEVTKNSLNYSRSAHILGIGINQFVSADQDISEILTMLKQQGALTIAAHPVPSRQGDLQTLHLWDNREKYHHLIDAWEVASGSEIFPEVLRSKLNKVASSDLHVPRQINSWKTLINARKDKDSVFSAIRQKDVDFFFFKEDLHGSGPTDGDSGIQYNHSIGLGDHQNDISS